MEVQSVNDSPIKQFSTVGLEPSVKLSSKTREKLEQLSKWRIDPSAIQFSKENADVHGGFASVCRASLFDPQNDGSCCDPQEVAVKKLKIYESEGVEKILGLALREARFLVELSHNNIVRLRGFVEEIANGRIWLVFPWAANGNLSSFVALGDWEVPERIQLIYGVINGLQYLHTRDPPIYHGDLKSVNIIVNSERQVVLTDFGSARRIEPKEAECDEPPTSDTSGSQPEMAVNATVDEFANTITLAGNQYTLRWAAPELLMDDKGGTEADIWSFGWVCYEVMTGCIPFSDTAGSIAVTFRICRGDLPFLDDHVRMSLIRSLGSLMVSCWSLAPGKRPTSTDCRKSMDWLPKCNPRSPQDLSSPMPEATLPLWLGHMYRLQSNLGKALDAFREALEIATKAENSTMQADALLGLADIHWQKSDFTEAVSLYEECLRIHGKNGNRNGEATALFGLAEIHRNRNEYSKAIPLYEECLRIREETGNRNGKAGALFGLAEIHRLRNEYPSAVLLYEECLRIHEDIGNRTGKAGALFGLAEIHRARGEYTKAVPLYEQCLRIQEETGNRSGKALVLSGLADIYRFRNDYTKAIPLYEECLRIREETGHRNGKAAALFALAEIQRFRAEYTKAISLYEECLRIRKEIGHRNGEAGALFGLAETYRAQHEYTTAVPLYEECLRIQEETGHRNGKAAALIGLASIHRARNEYPKAVPLYEECLRIREETGDQNGKAETVWGLAEILRAQNEYPKAIALYNESLEISQECGNRLLMAYSMLGLANIHSALDERSDAIKVYEAAAELLQQIDRTDDAVWASDQAAAIREQLLDDSNP